MTEIIFPLPTSLTIVRLWFHFIVLVLSKLPRLKISRYWTWCRSFCSLYLASNWLSLTTFFFFWPLSEWTREKREMKVKVGREYWESSWWRWSEEKYCFLGDFLQNFCFGLALQDKYGKICGLVVLISRLCEGMTISFPLNPFFWCFP